MATIQETLFNLRKLRWHHPIPDSMSRTQLAILAADWQASMMQALEDLDGMRRERDGLRRELAELTQRHEEIVKMVDEILRGIPIPPKYVRELEGSRLEAMCEAKMARLQAQKLRKERDALSARLEVFLDASRPPLCLPPLPSGEKERPS